MSELGTAVEEIRAEIASVAAEIFPDTCSIVTVASASNEYGDAEATRTTAATRIPCKYEPLSAREKVLAEAEETTLTHRLTLAVNARTLSIKPDQQIVVAARGNAAALTFENPTMLIGSYDPLLTIAANLKQT